MMMKVGEEGRRAKIEVEKLYNIPSADVLNSSISDAAKCTALASRTQLGSFRVENFSNLAAVSFASSHTVDIISHRFARKSTKLIKICWLLCARWQQSSYR